MSEVYGLFLVLFCTTIVIQANDNNVVLTKDLKVKFYNGNSIPMIGIGTGGIIESDKIRNVLDLALSSGYRLIDTASAYDNEEYIGKALKELLPKYNLTRKDIFITSKLAPSADSYGQNAYKALKKSVEKLGTDYIDLYLIHFPAIYPTPDTKMNYSQLRDESWQKLVQGKNEGLLKDIGVSNYNVKQLNELLNNDHGVKPVLNQIEWHPEYHPKDILDLCRKEGIVLQAYFSLGGVSNKTKLLEHPEVKKISVKLEKTPAQVLLRWAVQQNIPVIPKSFGKKHLEENLNLNFEIPEADMKILSSLKQTGKYIWDPDTII